MMSAVSDTSSGPRVKRWTVEQYDRLGEIGTFKDERVELLDGFVYAMHDGAPRRWTHEDYHAAVEAGLFDGERVGLIDGEVYVLSPMARRHASGILRVQAALYRIRTDDFFVSVQLPMELK